MKMLLAVAATKPVKYLSGGLMVRLVRNYPDIRDLSTRLLHMPIIQRGHFVTDLPNNDDQLIKYGAQNEHQMYMGYRVYRKNDKDQMETLLMCVDSKGRVVEPEKNRLDGTLSFVGVKVSPDDIKSRRYANKFNRLDFVKGE